MSFSGFGQTNNQQQQSSGFGGFGSNSNTTGTGFGQPQNSGFGTGSGSTLFGSNTTNTSGGFGSGTGGFGTATTNTTPFGQNRPAFGASTTTSGGGLFGSGTATAGSTTGFGVFGSTTNNTNNNNNASGGGLFGSTQKPTFGGGNTGGGLFGSGNAGGGFGSTNNQQQTGAFGAPISSALGTNNAECQGTGSTPFSAYTEKEGTGNTNNHFQSISFMAPYKNFSFEELRLADYNQGRRFGNASGQPAAFGQTNFGGFGQPQNTTGGFGQPANNAGGGLFGQPPTTSSSPFGTTQPAQSGFGTGNTGGSLFGQKSGTGGGLFGQSNTASTSQQSGGIFGTTGGAAGGFGSGTGTGSGFGAGGGIFGGNNQQQQQQQQQSKPFSFGGTTAATGGGFGTGTTGFGTNNNNTNNTGGGIFGNTGQTNSPFGQTQQQPAQTNPFGGFGAQNQNQTNTQPPFGGFGTQQQQEQKPGGLFGSQTANNPGGGGIFGNLNQNNQQQAPAGGLFGTNNNNNNQSGSSLFAPKPAATGGSLFGTANTSNSNQGGGLFSGFGNNNNNANQNQQSQAGGLFGANNNQQQKPGGLFGGSTGNTSGGLFNNLNNNNNQQPTGGSLFGSTGQQQQQQGGGSLFGNTNNNQGSSLFGNSQQQQQQPNALVPPPVFNASLTDPNNAYGSPSIFSGLPPPPMAVGPIATPINIKQKMKKSAVLPHYKMAPNAASRLVTPQKRGFGFSYSTYGTPGSATSNASTPGGLNSSLMFGSVGRGLGKSLSASNLRRNFDSDSESILTPGAFSAGSSRYGAAGSLKRLTIDRSLRTPDLFGDKGALPALPSPEKSDQSKQPGILKKKVSFDASTVGGNGENLNGVQVDGANGVNGVDMISTATPSAEEQGFLRTPSRGQGRLTGAKSNGVAQKPEMEQVRGNELAVVHEDESSESPSKSNARAPFQMPQDDQQPGAYWMKPSEDEIQKLPKDQRKQVQNFSVGREGCGRVEFNTPVDLSFTDLKDIYGNIVLIELRSLTVYPDQTRKPAQGKGLNVPSTIYLANSWPRQKDRRTLLPEKSGPRFNKHVDRLRKVGGTEFVRYEKDTGIWVFKVPHFTTYGFDYEDDDASEGESLQTSMLSELSGTPTPVSRAMRNGRTPTAPTSSQRSLASTNDSSGISSSPEDTFEFRKKKILPGAFEDQEGISDNEHDEMEQVQNDESFLDERLAASPSDSGEDEPSEIQHVKGEIKDRSVAVRDGDQDMDIDMAGAFPSPDLDEAEPKSLLQLGYGTPGKGMFSVGGDWAEELQRTISPRKQNRQALRETQAQLLKDHDVDEEQTPNAKLSTGSKLATSIDLMNSLFGQEQARRNGRNAKQATKGKGVKWPYSKKSNTNDDAMSNMTPEQQEMEKEWRDSYKPSWGPGEILLYAIAGKVGNTSNKSAQTDPILQKQKGTIVSEGRDIRFAKFAQTPNLFPLSLGQQQARTKFTLDRGVPMAKLQQTLFKNIASRVQPPSQYEQSVWELASILFDDQNPEAYGVPAAHKATYDHRIRKDRLILFWKRQCQETAMKAVGAAPNAEERAIAHLSANNVVEACDALVQGKDFRLATLVAQIGGDQIMRDDVTTQIAKWRELNVLSEITEPIRALYSLLAGDTCVCEGKKGPSEDRARTFVISERFNLDWKRAFGLRLFYAILAEDTIEVAVVKFEHDLQSDEGRKPVPWFVEEGKGALWDDPKAAQREDVLWGLLKIYAASKSALPTSSLAGILAPENISGNPIDARLSFQLYHAITARFPAISDPSKADYLAQTFAAQLDSAGEWYWALFSLLHLSSSRQRHMAIQSLLVQHADAISSDTKSELFNTLTEVCKIPVAWIWEAKALYARSVLQDHVQEVGFLVKAHDWKEAHDVFRKEVGPSAVVEQDWDTLQGVLDSFTDCKEQIAEWGMGGQVYDDYLSLMRGIEGDDKEQLLLRLLDALPTMMRGGKRELKESVAVQEISALVGKEVLAMKEKGMQGARVLQLPLTDDAYLRHTRDLSLQYYKAVMTGGT